MKNNATRDGGAGQIAPPATPPGYTLVSEPKPLHALCGEGRWIALAHNQAHAIFGVLIYEQEGAVVFMIAEESITVLAALTAWENTLIELCSEAYLIAHAADLAVCGYRLAYNRREEKEGTDEQQ